MPDEFSIDYLAEHDDEFFMRQALRQAVEASDAGEVPVGAVIVRNGAVVARAYNQVETLKDATAHAEILALTQAAAAVGDWRLNDCTMYVTKEPCPMCAGALVNSRIGRLVFGCPDPRGGAVGGALDLAHFPGLLHQFPCTGGIMQEECTEILRNFFRRQRQQKAAGSATDD